MKVIVSLALIISSCPLFAADEIKQGNDPFAGAFFPPELVLMARERIALTQVQLEALRARMEKIQSRSDELQKRLERETAALSALAKPERVDEAALVKQLDKVLDVERDMRHLHVGFAVAIKNLLTPEQQAKLREFAKDGVPPFGEDARKRLTEKVDRVREGAQEWADGGRDPSAVLRTMEEKFKPLMEAGKIVEAEAVLDRVLEQLAQVAK